MLKTRQAASVNVLRTSRTIARSVTPAVRYFNDQRIYELYRLVKTHYLDDVLLPPKQGSVTIARLKTCPCQRSAVSLPLADPIV